MMLSLCTSLQSILGHLQSPLGGNGRPAIALVGCGLVASGLGDNCRHSSWLAETGSWVAKGVEGGRNMGDSARVFGEEVRREKERHGEEETSGSSRAYGRWVRK